MVLEYFGFYETRASRCFRDPAADEAEAAEDAPRTRPFDPVRRVRPVELAGSAWTFGDSSLA